MNGSRFFFLPAISLLLTLGATSSALAQQSSSDLLQATQTSRLQKQLAEPQGYVPQDTSRSTPPPREPAVSRYSPTSRSNREFDRRQEDAALNRARQLKGAMKRAAASIPSPRGKASPEDSTGISDGSWQSDRLGRIREIEASRKQNGQGLMQRFGNALDSVASNDDYVRRRRAGEIEEGFHPFNRLTSIGRGEEKTASRHGDVNASSEVGGSGRLPGFAGAMKNKFAAMADTVLPDGSPAQEAPAVRDSPLLQGNRNTAAEMVPPLVSSRLAPPGPAAEKAVEPAGRFSQFLGSVPRLGRKTAPGEEVMDASVAAAPEPVGSSTDKPRSGGFSLLRRGDESPDRADSGGERFRQKPSREADESPLTEDPTYQVVEGKQGGEFYPYGTTSIGASTLPAGTLVRVTKPGEQWSAVKLNNGSEGIIRSGSLRRARESELPREVTRTTSRRIPSGVSAAKQPRASSPSYYNSPTEVPLPELPSQGQQPAMPLGHGLLPPLPPEN